MDFNEFSRNKMHGASGKNDASQITLENKFSSKNQRSYGTQSQENSNDEFYWATFILKVAACLTMTIQNQNAITTNEKLHQRANTESESE